MMGEAGATESGPRLMGEIEDTFTQMLTGAEEQPEEDSSDEEQPSTDSSDAGQGDAELADDSVVDEQQDDEPEDEQLDSDAQAFTVTVDGKPEEVPLDELIAGYHRYATYTKKSQELAQERQGFGEEQQALRQMHQQYSGVLSQLHQQMEAANKPPDMDWGALERENPVQFLKLKYLEQQRAGEIQAVQAEQGRMQQLLAGENQKKLQERLTVEQGLVLEKIPEWSDGDLQANEQRKLVEFGKAVGYSDNELNTLYDHRALVVLRDAMRYNELTNGDKITEAKSKIGSVKGGNKEISRQVRSRKTKEKRARLKSTGKVDDAAALFADILAK
tara:strand:- start:2083 stop:3075 length:993 start_codon:yes stop_codon:yes gene_type:complete